MTSELAKADIEEMWDEGLKPTVEDIVRLNALALKLEGARKKCAADSTEYLPRAAAISESVTFRQPTIGHEIWMEKVERFVEKGDCQSLLAVRAFALSRSLKSFPIRMRKRLCKKSFKATSIRSKTSHKTRFWRQLSM